MPETKEEKKKKHDKEVRTILKVSITLFVLSMVPVVVVGDRTNVCGEGFFTWYIFLAFALLLEQGYYAYNGIIKCNKALQLLWFVITAIMIVSFFHCLKDAPFRVQCGIISAGVIAALYCACAGWALSCWSYDKFCRSEKPADDSEDEYAPQA